MNNGHSANNGHHGPIVVFSHDVHDARFHKRMNMFSDMGFPVRWLGFDRKRGTKLTDKVLQVYPGRVLGHKTDSKYLNRLVDMSGAVAKMFSKAILPSDASIVYCINLDNLLLAILVKRLRGMRSKIVYEVADIQSILLKPGAIGKAVRAVERWCLKETDLVVYTSEHFMTEFMKPQQHCTVPSLLLENKIYPGSSLPPKGAPATHGKDKPIVVGYFGQIRCRRSLELMRGLAAALPGKIQFVLRGYPNHEAQEVFDEVIKDKVNFDYGGPYRNPDDLGALYGEVDVCWGFDFCCPGTNSRWCLTNRLYESGFFGVPILVEEGTAGGEFVKRIGSGWTMPEPLEQSLLKFFSTISPEEIRAKRSHTAGLDSRTFVLDADLPSLRKAFLPLAN